MIIPVAAVVLFLALAVAQSRYRVVAAVGAVVTSTALVPISLSPDTVRSFHVGIAGASPQVRTFTIVTIVVALIVLLRFGIRAVTLPHVLFVGWLALGAAHFWTTGPLLAAGALQLVVGIAAWWAGSGTARVRHRLTDERAICLFLCGVVALEVVVCLLQFAGFGINRLDFTETSILGDRVNGTANHPNNLGKLLIACLLVLLPLSESKDAQTARLAFAASLAMFVPLGLSQGRANMAAFLCAMLLWVLLSPRSRYGGRVLVVGASAIAAAGAFATVFLARFEEDPAGGVRSDILRIALEEVPRHVTHGVGPNSYVAEIASNRGSFIPVHNSYVLMLAEVGIIGIVLFMTPIAYAVVRCARRATDNRHARALAVVTPGLFAMGWTGWGLLGTSVLPLLMFAAAYVYGRAFAGSDDEDDAADGDTERQRPERTELVAVSAVEHRT